MKKLNILSIIAITAIALVSCKKDRVCECSVGSQVINKITLNETTKRTAKDACVSYTVDFGQGSAVKIECKLK